jgi:hypothetical protein
VATRRHSLRLGDVCRSATTAELILVKHIGIRVCGPPSINELLYFDEIAIVDNELATSLGIELTRSELDRIDFLARKGVLVSPHSVLATSEAHDILVTKQSIFIERASRALSILEAPSTETATAEHIIETRDARMKGISQLRVALEEALALPYRAAFDAHPDYQPTTILNLHPTKSHQMSGASVLDVIIKKFPIPSCDVSLEHLLEFRADTDAMLALRRLRKWATKCASDQVSLKELEEEIQDLVDKYTEYMNLHRLKYECGVLRTFVSATLELAENLMRLRVKAAFETLFTLRTNSLALTEAELKAPGREVAYLILAKEKLVQ